MKIRKRTWTDASGKKHTAWLLDYFDQRGKRRRPQYVTKAEAEAARREIAADIGQGKHRPEARGYTVSDAIDTYLDGIKNGTLTRSNKQLRERTVERYERYLERLIRPHLGRTRLSDLDTPAVARFRDWLVKESGAGERDREIAFQLLKSALNEMRHRELVGSDSWSAITIARNRRKTTSESGDNDDEDIEATPSDDEVAKIIRTWRDIANGDWSQINLRDRRGLNRVEGSMRIYGPIIELIAFTGLRSSEARALKVKDVDLSKPELRVRRSLDDKNRLSETKSEAGRRTIPLPQAALDVLRPRTENRPGGEWVFATANGTPLGYNNIYKRGWQNILKYAGLPRYRIHALRHYYASCLIAAGADALEVKELVGHADIKTTLNVYGHLLRSDADKRRERVEAIAARFTPSQGMEA